MINPQKAIHLVSGNSGRGVLQHYFNTNFPDDRLQIHCIYSDLTAGPLTDLVSPSDCEAYRSYWKTIDKTCKQGEIESDDKQFIENDFNLPNLSTEFIIDFPEDRPLIIWHGNETNEKLMLYRYCSLIKNRELYEINLNDWPTPSDHPYKNNCLATRNPEHLNGIFKIVKKIDNNSTSFYTEEWKRLKNDQKLYRILQGNRILSVDENYYDKNILDNCTSAYKNAASVIGKTMGQQESTVGDYYLLYRIHELINQNLIEWRGNLAAMRYFEIRKTSK